MRLLGAIILMLLLTKSYAQVTDDLRLGYEVKGGWRQMKVVASPDGRYLAFAYQNFADSVGIKDRYFNQMIRIFDTKAQVYVSTTTTNLIYPYLMTFTSPQELLYIGVPKTAKFIGKGDYKIFSYDISTGAHTERYAIQTLIDFNSSLNYSTALKRVLFTSKKSAMALKKLLTVLDPADSYKEIYTIESGDTNSELAFEHSSKVVAASSINQIKLIDLLTGKTINTIELPRGDALNGICLDDRGRLGYLFYRRPIGLGSTYKNDVYFVKVMDVQEGTFYERQLSGFEPKGMISTIRLDDNYLITGYNTAFSAMDIRNGATVYHSEADKLSMVIGGTYVPTRLVKLSAGKYFVYSEKSAGKDKEYVFYNNSKLYDVANKMMTGYFYSDGVNYCVVSRDGRVDGDAEALHEVYWTSRRSDQKTYLDRTIDKNYTPKLLAALLSDQDKQIETAFDIDQALTKIPVLQLATFNNQAIDDLALKSNLKTNKLGVKVSSNPEEIQEVRLHQNGKLVRALPNGGGSTYTFDVSLTNAFGPDNYFFVTATSKSGVEAEKVKFKIQYSGASVDNPRMYLLTIGINEYKNPKYNLNYALADANGVEELIKSKSTSIFENIITYTIRNNQATKPNIIKALEDIRSKSKEQDMLLIYYAGHGVMAGDEEQNKEFFLVPHDVTQLYGKNDMMMEKGISATELKGFTQSINAQKQVFILDACQSAGVIESVGMRGAAEEKIIAQLAHATGTFWITSAGSSQFAAEVEKLGHGVFTHSLLEGLQGAGDANKDTKLTIRELSTYVENIVPDLSEKWSGKSQYPAAYSFGNDFVLMLTGNKE